MRGSKAEAPRPSKQAATPSNLTGKATPRSLYPLSNRAGSGHDPEAPGRPVENEAHAFAGSGAFRDQVAGRGFASIPGSDIPPMTEAAEHRIPFISWKRDRGTGPRAARRGRSGSPDREGGCRPPNPRSGFRHDGEAWLVNHGILDTFDVEKVENENDSQRKKSIDGSAGSVQMNSISGAP